MKKHLFSILIVFTLMMTLAFPVVANSEDFTVTNGVFKNINPFIDTDGLTDINIPKGVTELADNVFFDCYNLKSVNIPEGVLKIGENAFWGCSSLETITIPSSVKSIGKNALGYDRDGDFHVKHDGFVIKGAEGSQAQRYAKDNGFKFISIAKLASTKSTPHPFSNALREFINGAQGDKKAYLADINKDGINEMIAYRTRDDGALENRLFFFHNGKLRTYDEVKIEGVLFSTKNNFLVSWDTGLYDQYKIYSIKNGEVTTELGLLWTQENDEFWLNDRKISESNYKELLKKYGLENKEFYRNIQDETNKILAMTSVTDVKFDKVTISLSKGKTYALKAIVSPSNASIKAVKWSSTNTKVATVDKNGNIKGVNKGTATITVTTTDGTQISKKCVITVK